MDVKQFLARCVTKDPSQRPFAADLQSHPFLNGGADKKPIRELLKLADAEIEEVLEDLSEEQVKELQAQSKLAARPSTSSLPVMEIAAADLAHQQHAIEEVASESHRAQSQRNSPTLEQAQMTKYAYSLAGMVDTNATSSDGRVSISQPVSIPEINVGQSRPNTANASRGAAPGTPTSAPQPYLLSTHKPSPLVGSAMASMNTSAALIQSALSPMDEGALRRAATAGDDDKKYKTLTRTRKYINEEGETVTIKTSRIVETAAASGKVATLRRGAANEVQDWGAADQTKLALFRKQQLREMKIIQRDEQKECSELIVQLKVERDQCVC